MDCPHPICSDMIRKNDIEPALQAFLAAHPHRRMAIGTCEFGNCFLSGVVSEIQPGHWALRWADKSLVFFCLIGECAKNSDLPLHAVALGGSGGRQ
jgi:hypothetical protein